MYTYMYMCMDVYAYIYIYMYLYTHMHMHMFMHIHMYIICIYNASQNVRLSNIRSVRYQNQINLMMPEEVQYQTKPTQSGIF
jgi:hypothetical protein